MHGFFTGHCKKKKLTNRNLPNALHVVDAFMLTKAFNKALADDMGITLIKWLGSIIQRDKRVANR